MKRNGSENFSLRCEKSDFFFSHLKQNENEMKRKQNEKSKNFKAKKDNVQSLQSPMILTMSHWSSGLPVCFPPQGTQVQIPWGGTYVKPGFSC
jgi:hypothetical protein